MNEYVDDDDGGVGGLKTEMANAKELHSLAHINAKNFFCFFFVKDLKLSWLSLF